MSNQCLTFVDFRIQPLTKLCFTIKPNKHFLPVTTNLSLSNSSFVTLSQTLIHTHVSNMNVTNIFYSFVVKKEEFKPLFYFLPFHLQNTGFAESSLKESATLPCIARLCARKENNWIQIILRKSAWVVYGQVGDRYAWQSR